MFSKAKNYVKGRIHKKLIKLKIQTKKLTLERWLQFWVNYFAFPLFWTLMDSWSCPIELSNICFVKWLLESPLCRWRLIGFIRFQINMFLFLDWNFTFWVANKTDLWFKTQKNLLSKALERNPQQFQIQHDNNLCNNTPAQY